MELDEFLSEEEAAAAIGKSLRTLRQWRRRGIGPPYVLFGRTVRYRKPTFVEHFRQAEIRPVHTRKSGKPEAGSSWRASSTPEFRRRVGKAATA